MPVPYAGDPTNFPQSVDILSGSDAPSSTNFNVAFEGILDRTASLNAGLVANGGINWDLLRNINPWAFSVGTAIWSACWDPFNEQWLVGNSYDNFGTGTALLNYSYNGRDWNQVSPLLGHPTWFPIAMACDPLGTVAMVRTDFGANHSVTVQTRPFSPVEVTPVGSGTFAPGQGVMAFYGDGTVDSSWVYVGASGVTTSTGWTGMALRGQVTGSGPPPVTTFTNEQSTLPSNWFPSGTSSNSVLQWLAVADESFPGAGNATQVVFAQCGSRPGTDKSFLMSWSVVGGFTDITPSFLNSGAYQVRGIAWSPVDQLWGMICVDGDSNGHGTTPANSYFLTSPDLVTWSVVFVFAAFQALGLACNGSIWSILVCETLYAAQTSNRVLFSTNVSKGVLQTWEAADYCDTPSLTTVVTGGGYPGRIYMGNSAQFMTAYPFGVYLPGGLPLLADAGVSNLAINGLG